MGLEIKQSFPLRSSAEVRAFERAALPDEGSVMHAVKEAGAAIASALHADYQEWRPWPTEPHILVLLGKGLNAADAVVACDGLARRLPGLGVTLVAAFPRSAWHPVLATVISELEQSLQDKLFITEDADSLSCEQVDVLIDGLLGLNFRPPLRPEIGRLLEAASNLRSVGIRASIDLPTGIGEAVEETAFVADFTYMVGLAKAEAFAEAARAKMGRIRYLPLQIFGSDSEKTPDSVVNPEYFKVLNVLRSAQAEKRQLGHVLLVAGSAGMPGAAAMATRAALESGAGLVTTLTSRDVIGALASSLPEAMWQSVPLNASGGITGDLVRMLAEFAPRAGSLLLGPGLPADPITRSTVASIVRQVPLPLVLDASALYPEMLSAIRQRTQSAGPVILTPHLGEWQRLTRGIRFTKGLEAALRAVSQQYHLSILLKGAPSIIAHTGRLYYAPVGGPVLARGGSGDILSGILATLLAQASDDPLGALSAAVTWQGAAADALARDRGQHAVRTTEILGYLSPVLRG
jgi:NAD(P)H-hydrate epimerase